MVPALLRDSSARISRNRHRSEFQEPCIQLRDDQQRPSLVRVYAPWRISADASSFSMGGEGVTKGRKGIPYTMGGYDRAPAAPSFGRDRYRQHQPLGRMSMESIRHILLCERIHRIHRPGPLYPNICRRTVMEEDSCIRHSFLDHRICRYSRRLLAFHADRKRIPYICAI